MAFPGDSRQQDITRWDALRQGAGPSQSL